MSKKGIFYILFFVVLVGIFYIIVQRWIKTNDTISVVQPFAFIDQDGKRVTNNDLKGKVYVAEYFYTTCEGICPVMNGNMRQVYEEFLDKDNFLILSHTVQPEIDSPAVLKKFAESLGVNTNRWIFLTGRKDSLYNTARVSYNIDDPKNNLKSVDDDFIHSQLWALVDGEGNVKHIYDGLKQKEVKAMIRKIKKML